MTDKLHLTVDLERLTLNDMVALDEGNASPRFLREFLSKFMTNGNGQFLGKEEALEAAGDLSMADVKRAVELFAEEVKSEAVNPTKKPS